MDVKSLLLFVIQGGAGTVAAWLMGEIAWPGHWTDQAIKLIRWGIQAVVGLVAWLLLGYAMGTWWGLDMPPQTVGDWIVGALGVLAAVFGYEVRKVPAAVRKLASR